MVSLSSCTVQSPRAYDGKLLKSASDSIATDTFDQRPALFVLSTFSVPGVPIGLTYVLL